MRRAIPNLNFAHQAGPSSPPQSPTSAGRPHLPCSEWSLPTNDATIKPKGNVPNFSYITPDLDVDLASSRHSSIASSSTNSPPRSCSSSPAPAPLYSPHRPRPPPHPRPRVVAKRNFSLEEFTEKEYEGFESEDHDVVRPYQYEDAESDRAKSVASNTDERQCGIDVQILSGLEELNCEDDEEDTEWMGATKKAWRYQKKKGYGYSSKRSFGQSIESDTDEEDLQPVEVEKNEAGSSARRLRRKMGDRTSLIFDDLPFPFSFVTIDEVKKEPGSGFELNYEELFPTRGAKESSPWQALVKKIPYQTIPSANWESAIQSESILSDSDSDHSLSCLVEIERLKFFAVEPLQDRLEGAHGHSQSSSMTESSAPEDATDWEEDSDVDLWIGARSPDGYFSAELEGQPALSNTLEPIKKQMVDRLMEEFWIIFNEKWPAGARQRPGAPTTETNTTTISASNNSARTLSGGIAGASQSRRNREDGDSEDGPEKGSGGNGKQPESMPSANETATGFACPFRKRNPRKYCIKNWRSCALSPHKTVARVNCRAHLYRCHIIHQCQRCNCLPNSEEELDSHIETSSNCDAIVAPPVDDITRKIKSSLQCKRKAFPGQTEAERWKQVYQILFPLDEEVPDPYFEPIRENEESEPLSPDFANLTNYEDFLRRMLPRLVRSALETEVNNDIQPIEDRLRGQIMEVIEQAQNRAFQEYRGMMEESFSTDPSVDSGYVSNQAGIGPSRDKGKGPESIGPAESSTLYSPGPSNRREAAEPPPSHFFGSEHTSNFESTAELEHSFPPMGPPENFHFEENMPDDFVASEGFLLSNRLQSQDQPDPDMVDLNSVDWSHFLEEDSNLK